MMRYLRRYPVSLLLVLIILYLSFYTPTETDLDTIPNIDKIVHFLMYGGFSSVVWFEYLRRHRKLNKLRLLLGAIFLPCLFSGVIELLQENCTVNRGGEWMDLLANCMGVCLGAFIGYFILRPFVWKYLATEKSIV